MMHFHKFVGNLFRILVFSVGIGVCGPQRSDIFIRQQVILDVKWEIDMFNIKNDSKRL